MDIEGVLAILLIFGGGTACAIAFSPIGRAIAERIRGPRAAPVEDSVLREEVELLRQELAELHERVDFAERLLAQRADGPAVRMIPGAEPHGER